MPVRCTGIEKITLLLKEQSAQGEIIWMYNCGIKIKELLRILTWKHSLIKYDSLKRKCIFVVINV